MFKAVLVVATCLALWGMWRTLGNEAPRSGAVGAEPMAGPEVETTIFAGAMAPRMSEPVRRTHVRRIAESQTYLGLALEEQDSLLRRWVDREDRPVRVYHEPAAVEGYTPALGRAVFDAFARWRRVPEVPVRFDRVESPDDADVIVRWIRAFDRSTRHVGLANMLSDSNGKIIEGTLTLATFTTQGYPLEADDLFTVALHEIGHMLGLGHSDQPRDVMFPTMSVHDLTPRDRQTAALLYSIPAGSLKAP